MAVQGSVPIAAAVAHIGRAAIIPSAPNATARENVPSVGEQVTEGCFVSIGISSGRYCSDRY